MNGELGVVRLCLRETVDVVTVKIGQNRSHVNSSMICRSEEVWLESSRRGKFAYNFVYTVT